LRKASQCLGCGSFVPARTREQAASDKPVVPGAGDVYTEYPDPRRDEWNTKWLPMVRSTPVSQLLDHGVSRATVYAVRAGRNLYGSTRAKLVKALQAISDPTPRSS
jgi:hypothetical protein